MYLDDLYNSRLKNKIQNKKIKIKIKNISR